MITAVSIHAPRGESGRGYASPKSVYPPERGGFNQGLSDEELAQQWDEQIAADAASGKLDFLMAEALGAEQKGQLIDLCFNPLPTSEAGRKAATR